MNDQYSIVFNNTCLNNNLLPKYTPLKEYIYIYIYIERERERERGREKVREREREKEKKVCFRKIVYMCLNLSVDIILNVRVGEKKDKSKKKQEY